MVSPLPPSNGLSPILRRMRSAVALACSSVVAGITRRNSSPPLRMKTSNFRTNERTRSQKVRSTASPTACPNVSFARLK
jgi:hypothetical protein